MAEEPANFLAAPAPDFFSKRLRLQGAKNTLLRLPSPGFLTYPDLRFLIILSKY